MTPFGCNEMRRLSLFLTLLMVLAPMTTLIPALEDSTTKLESYEATDGWGESLAYDEIQHDGIDWEVLPTRGVSDWVQSSISNFSDSVEDLDIAIGPDQVVKACGYNVDTQDLEVYTLSPDGTTSRVTVDSNGDVGRGCSIIVDYRGFARVAYLDVDASSLKVVRENDDTPAVGDEWLVRTLVNDVTITSPPEIAIYSNGSIAIAYRDADTGGLDLMRYTGSWWRHTDLVEEGTAEDIVLNIDVNDILHLSFVDTINERVAVISLDQDERTFSVVDEGEGIGQPLGHYLDATTRAQLVYGIENGSGLRIVRDLTGRDDGRISPDPLLVLESSESTGFGTDANANGDYNADGFSDLIYGEPGADNDSGAVHIHYGSVNGYATTPDLSLLGLHEGARFGASLAMVGDVDGNGYDDILVGTPGQNNDSGNTTGAVFLYSGFATGLNSNPSWIESGQTIDGLFGANVEAAGDVNGDGLADLLVSEMGWESPDQELGRVHVYLGNSSLQFESTIIEGGATDLILGYATLGVGDANADGFDDVVIGSSKDQTAVSGRGQAQVHYGSMDGISSTANRTWSVTTTWTLLGNSLSALGDVNGDGYDDFVISEILANKLWIFYGSVDGYSENPTMLMDIAGGWGWNIQTAGDINDDGIGDFLIGNVQGELELVPGTNDSNLVDSTSDFYTRNEGANSLLGRILSAGGDADRDGTHEFLYASTTRMNDGVTTGGSIVIMETRDWELSDLPFNFTVDSLDLAVDAQGRTQLLLDTNEGYYHYERANELLTSSDPWGMNDFGQDASAAMVVSPAGQPTVITSDGAGVDFNQAAGKIFVSNEILTGGFAVHGSIAAPIPDRSMSAFHFISSGSKSIVFANQSSNAIDTEVIVSDPNLVIEQDMSLLVNSNKTPHIVWRNADTNEIQLAVQNGSTWDESTLATDADGRQFGAVMADNGSIGLMYRHNTSSNAEWGELVTEWVEAAADSWSITERTVLASNDTFSLGYASMQLSGSAFEVVWQDNNLQWHHQFSQSGSVTNQSIPSIITSGSHGFPGFTSDGILIPGILANTSGSHVLVDSTGSRTVDLNCHLNEFELLTDASGEDWVICANPTGTLTINTLEGNQPIEFGSSWQTSLNPAATLDENGTWHILFHHPSSVGTVSLLRGLADTDRDFIPNIIDDLPEFGGQWTDSDGDGYGDNPDAPSVDMCPTIVGYSAYGHHGCGDVDGDGFANAIDDCPNSGKSWRDTLGCPDTDGDGWSNPSGDAGWDGDRHPTNWMQAIDTDGDGRYDNHGPDCCGQNTESDEFPLDPQQWVDEDGDGWGDNSSAPTGDKCPGFDGDSIYDRGGCLDSDGDGWSDPENPTSSKPYGWTYNATRCYNSWVDDEGNTRAAGEHCADLFPWAPVDTSPENVCGILCYQQWGDRDGDGYGDNDSQDAWNRDAFPLDGTQHTDSDEDGYGDNPDGNNADDCPIIWGNSTVDKKGCTDTDGDGHSDLYTYDLNPETGLRENEVGDALPDDPNQWRDRDGDGFGENSVGNWDRCFEIPGALLGVPGPGCPMPVGDEDGDNIPDEDDLCADTPEGEIANTDGCSPSQIDTDGDFVFDDVDICPNTPTNEIANSVGCSLSQTDIDTDGDGVNDVDENADQLDMCPNTVEDDYDEVDENGCAPSQLDTDGDGVTDDLDQCPDTTSGATVTAEGCIVVGADSDDDGYEDAFDAFPSDPTQWHDTDGDGYGDNWGELGWNDFREDLNIGEWVYNAQDPDACPLDSGTSWSANRQLLGLYGCPDTDGDGVPDPTVDWTTDNGADFFPNDPMQYGDIDGDGFGDYPYEDGDFCPNQPGLADYDENGPHENGCPPLDADNDGVYNSLDQCQATATNSTVDSNGCAEYQRDSDGDYVKDDKDLCPNTPAQDSNLVDIDGCTPTQLAGDEGSALLGGSMNNIAIGFGVFIGIALIMLVIRRVRSGGIDWDDDEGDDFYDDDEEEDWSPFGSGASTTPTKSFSDTQPSRSPPSRSPSPTPSRGPPMGGRQGPPTRSRGPPSTQSTGPSTAVPPGSFRPRGPTRSPGSSKPGMRPSPSPSERPVQKSSSVPASPARKTRRTAAPTTTTEDSPVRKTRKTSRSSAPSVPARKTRRTAGAPKKTSRRRKASASFDDLFGPDEKADFDTAVSSAKERLIVGDSEQSVLARLQSEGWNVKQSKHILGQARP